MRSKTLVVGSNPSMRSVNSDAFHESTKSGRILRSWLVHLDTDLHIVNTCDNFTEGNRQLSVAEIKLSLPALLAKIEAIKPTHIVAVGKTAEKALTLLQLRFYSMPHPSGRNRKCNDKNFIAEKIKGLGLFILGLK